MLIYFNELIRMEMSVSILRFYYFSLKRAWVDVNSFCYILPVLLVSGPIFLIVTVSTVSKLLKVITMDQSSPGSYKNLCSPHCS